MVGVDHYSGAMVVVQRGHGAGAGERGAASIKGRIAIIRAIQPFNFMTPRLE